MDRMRMDEENRIHSDYRIALYQNAKKPAKEYERSLLAIQDEVVEHAPIDIEKSREMSKLIDSLGGDLNG